MDDTTLIDTELNPEGPGADMGLSLEKQRVETPSGSSGEKRKPAGNWRLRAALRGNLEFVIGNAGHLDVQGRENFDKLDPQKMTIVVPSLLTDVDVQMAAYAMMKEGVVEKPKIVNQSTQFHKDQDKQAYIGISIAGKDNFLPVDYRAGTADTPASAKPFNPDNFKKIAEAMHEGYTPVMAAYNPRYDGEMPDQGGYGVVYLAQLLGTENVQILPIGVTIDAKEQAAYANNIKGVLKGVKNRPNGHVHVGEPITLERIEDIHALFTKQEGGGKDITPDIAVQFSQARADRKEKRAILGQQSDRIMHSLRQLTGKDKTTATPLSTTLVQNAT